MDGMFVDGWVWMGALNGGFVVDRCCEWWVVDGGLWTLCCGCRFGDNAFVLEIRVCCRYECAADMIVLRSEYIANAYML